MYLRALYTASSLQILCVNKGCSTGKHNLPQSTFARTEKRSSHKDGSMDSEELGPVETPAACLTNYAK